MISLGPINLPLRFLLLAACAVLAVLAARLPLRRYARARSRITGLLTNALTLFVVAWKLTPSILHPLSLLSDPLSLLLASPGLAGVGVGAGCAASYSFIWLWKHQRLRRAGLFSLVVFTGVLGASALLTELALAKARPTRFAPELALSSLSGDVVSLASLRGKVVVLNFWATWCAPCRAELPELVSFVDGPGIDGTVLLGVNLTATESSVAEVADLVAARGIRFAVLLDPDGAAASAYGIEVIPTTVVVAPDGRITAERSGAVDAGWLRRESRRALGAPAPAPARASPARGSGS